MQEVSDNLDPINAIALIFQSAKKEGFTSMPEGSSPLYWEPEQHRPSVDEAKAHMHLALVGYFTGSKVSNFRLLLTIPR
jgi:hypothetical protein